MKTITTSEKTLKTGKKVVARLGNQQASIDFDANLTAEQNHAGAAYAMIAKVVRPDRRGILAATARAETVSETKMRFGVSL